MDTVQRDLITSSPMSNVQNETFLLSKRPEKGLLAGLWEFPSVDISDDVADEELGSNVSLSIACNISTTICMSQEEMLRSWSVVAKSLDVSSPASVTADAITYHGTVKHVFTHLVHHYAVYSIKIDAATSSSINLVQTGIQIRHHMVLTFPSG